MKSPFPGMDPYLEAHWGDVHASIAIYARNQLQPQMPPDLKVRVEEYIAVEDVDDEEIRHVAPDVRIVESTLPLSSGAATAVVDAETLTDDDQPLLVRNYVEQPTQREIRIVDARDGGRIITAIEILSPTNKGSGRRDYRKKQREFLEAGVSLVEIDLQRAGSWVLAARKEAVKKAYRGPYRICVIRATDQHVAEMYRATYASRLPRLRIPLRPSEPDVRLDLQAVIDQAYRDGGYGDTDYSREPDPPLSPEEAKWVDKLLREQGRR
jgi:hypothetical protein